MRLIALDPRDTLGRLIETRVQADVWYDSLNDLVARLSAQAGPGQITELHVIDQGHRTGIELGDDWLSAQTFAPYADSIATLSPLMHPTGALVLHACFAHTQSKLCIQIAASLKRPVYAAQHNPAEALPWLTPRYAARIKAPGLAMEAGTGSPLDRLQEGLWTRHDPDAVVTKDQAVPQPQPLPAARRTLPPSAQDPHSSANPL